MKRFASFLFVVALFAVSPAFAATKTADLNVTANVAANCTITTNPVAFGAYDPVVANASTDLDAEGSVVVACTKGATGLRIDLGQGNNFNVTRRMAGGASFLGYGLFTDSGRSTPWGAGAGVGGGQSISSPASKAARTFQVYGRVPANQDVEVNASYADVVVATINY